MDGYHTCYNLAGLSASQHKFEYEPVSGGQKSLLPAAFGWSVAGTTKEAEELCEKSDLVNPVHPVFVIPFEAVEAARKKFAGTKLS